MQSNQKNDEKSPFDQNDMDSIRNPNIGMDVGTGNLTDMMNRLSLDSNNIYGSGFSPFNQTSNENLMAQINSMTNPLHSQMNPQLSALQNQSAGDVFNFDLNQRGINSQLNPNLSQSMNPLMNMQNLGMNDIMNPNVAKQKKGNKNKAKKAQNNKMQNSNNQMNLLNQLGQYMNFNNPAMGMGGALNQNNLMNPQQLN